MNKNSKIFFDSFCNQIRVINALVLREVHTLYGRSKYGFLLTMLQTAIGVGIMMGIRMLFQMKPPHGMEIILWLLTAYFAWNIFTDINNKCMTGVGPNKPLLSFPQVHVMDIMLARVIFIFVMQVATFCCLVTLYNYFVDPIELVRPWLLLSAVLFVIPLGLGVGLCFSAIISFFPGFKIVSVAFNRILFFTSGLIFPVDRIPQLETFSYYNPLVQILEMMRLAFCRTYIGIDFRFEYLFIFSFFMLFMGLAVERIIHRNMEF